ncbi:DUF1496 domain-containing protein [Thioclava sp. A2]|uniref:DUF1496 domain-containing protein n=1 Tax=Thioclava sp. FCG-A2 TaxID=3080562 RepID=UPI00295416C7|nr:DUF1496 domain-containing protein [Thioclava sp. A2]MDV7269442.1 DUF1496 domain-containing protein [Thioclava sp. A2]
MTDKIVQLGPIDPEKQTSPITDEQATGEAQERAPCWYNSQQFTQGARVCGGGRVIVCQQNGTWWNTHEKC